jgi:SAM-dependent methyltransferase
MIRDWPSDDSVEWLNPADTEIALHCIGIIKIRNNNKNVINILEVGVWKGGWSFTLCKNAENIYITGIDPYPNLAEIQKRVIEESAKYDNFTLQPDWRGVSEKLFDIIHLDGEHTEKAVAEDLIKCLDHLKPGGILIVDDIRHPYFPGVAYSIWKFIAEHKLAMLIFSEYKAYLCREEDFYLIQSLIIESIKKSELIFENYINESSPDKIPYPENPTVRGFPVILCVQESNRWRALPKENTDSIKVLPHNNAYQDMKQFIKNLIKL